MKYPKGLVENPDEYNSWGYYNIWGGFHRTRDREAYWIFLKEAVKHPGPLWFRAMWRMARERWRHRRCNTEDFHHYACLLDRFGKKLNDDYRWNRLWKGEPDWRDYHG